MAENKIGRPTLYDINIHPELVYKLAADGLIDTEIAREMGIATSTLNDWKIRNPEFLESLKKGKAIVDQKVVKSLLKRALGYEITETKRTDDNHSVKIETTDKFIPGDTGAMIFWLKNRCSEDWRDKVQNEISGPDGAPLTLNLIRTDFKQKSDE